ncbi:MAG: DNA topoisomerase IV subunit B [Thermaurantiacus sp.]
MADLFAAAATASQPSGYDASEIEVLEGLEPVRRRPGMYVGGTDARALHHLAAEVLDNAMDEAVAGHASRIEVHLEADGTLTVSDNGRGIPIDPHPRFPDKSALEVVMTTLHSGGKFSGKSYQTSGGLHGVGVSVVNALSAHLEVEVARGRQLFRQSYSRGAPLGPLELVGPAPNRRGTRVAFRPDAEIFGQGVRFSPERLWRLARSKAYLFSGVEIRWSCDASLAREPVPEAQTFLFPGGLLDRLAEEMEGQPTATDQPFAGRAKVSGEVAAGEVEWALAWSLHGDGAASWYCNTIPTPDGGTHEAGLRAALVKSLRAHAGLMGMKKGAEISAEDALSGAVVMLSLFMPEPQFQSQTKDRLASPEAARMVESAIRDRLDHWLAEDQDRARALLGHVIERLEERLARRAEREVKRKTATSKRNLRLPGKLTDCARQDPEGTELFIVEGDSAGGSAKQARNRETQAILPIRGKILNVASAAAAKISGNQEVADLALALGCGTRDRYDAARLRYERIVIMTDADVDGAHIATLLMTFFFREMPGLVRDGRLYLAQPPLYRLSAGSDIAYARDDADRLHLQDTRFRGRKVDVARFKGLGEMSPGQLRETTMDPATRTLLRVRVPDSYQGEAPVRDLVERLMGRVPEHRFQFIQANAARLEAGAIDA